jgi:4-hydroxy-3-polyprenylbenzoate decarboxylase
VGKPPMEDFYLGHATERIFLPLLKLTTPEIVDYHMPAEGVFHNLVLREHQEAVPGARLQGDERALGRRPDVAGQGDRRGGRGVDVRNPQEAWWVALNNIDPERDTRFTMGPVDVLDHASRAFTYGSKMGIDGTRKWPEEGFTRNWPKVIEMDAATKAKVDACGPSLGIETK